MSTTEPTRPHSAYPAAPDEEADEQTSALLEEVRLPNAEAVNIFATLVRYPGLYRRWMPLRASCSPASCRPATASS